MDYNLLAKREQSMRRADGLPRSWSVPADKACHLKWPLAPDTSGASAAEELLALIGRR